MRQLLLISVLALPVAVLSNPGVLVEATNDTVMKVKYTGSTPSSLTHPAVTVEGKAIGLKANAYGVQYATAVIGQVGTSALPTNYGSQVGVIGAGSVGVWGNGSSVGVNSYGWDAGVQAVGDYAGYFVGTVYVVGPIHATGSITEGSDLALKENVRPLSKGLETVLALKPKAYEMKSGITSVTSKGTRFGLIAQDLQPLIPEVVEMKKLPAQREDGPVTLKPPGRNSSRSTIPA